MTIVIIYTSFFYTPSSRRRGWRGIRRDAEGARRSDCQQYSDENWRHRDPGDQQVERGTRDDLQEPPETALYDLVKEALLRK